MALNDGLRRTFQTRLAKLLMEDFSTESDNRYFIFFGKPLPWTAESTPDSAIDSNQTLYEANRSMVGMKMIRPSDVYLMVARHDWISGTTYAQYEDAVDVFDTTFCVLTDDNNVYKCISNNGSIPSTTQPTGTSPYIFTTQDDEYKWKFLFKLTEDATRFLTLEYVPVSLALSKTINETLPQFIAQSYAVDGALDLYTVEEGTAVYSRATTKTYRIGNPNEGTSIDPTTGDALDPTTINIAGSRFVKLNAQMTGDDPNADFSNYYNNFSVYVASGRGREVGQIHNIVAYHGPSKVAYIYPPLQFDLFQEEAVGGGEIILPATQYQIIPTLVIQGDGSGATARPIVTSDKTITSVRALKRGLNYTVAEVSVLSPADSGTVPTITAMIGPKGGHGSDAVAETGAVAMMIALDMNGDEEGNLDVINDYRQWGLIRNPILSDETGRVAGTELPRVGLMQIDRPHFVATPYTYVTNPTFPAGSFIMGAETGSIGKVIDWKSVPGENYGLLSVTPVSGSFRSNINDDRVRIVFTDSAAGDFVVGSEIQQFAVEANNYGLTAQGVVLSWTPGATFGPELTVKVTTGAFDVDGATISSGEVAYGNDSFLAVEREGGEQIRLLTVDSYGDLTTENFTTTGVTGPDTTQMIGRIVLYDRTKTVDEGSVAYRQTWKLRISGSTAAAFPDNLFAEDNSFTQTNTDSLIVTEGTIVSWITGGGSTGDLYLTDVRGTFNAKVNGSGGNFVYDPENTDQSSEDLNPTYPGIHIQSVEKPETQTGSGEVLYIQNVRGVDRSLEQGEEFRIMIGF